MFDLCVHMHTMCVPSTHEDQVGASEPLELELQEVVSHHVRVGDLTLVI